MQRLLNSLRVFLMVAALGFSTSGNAFASPCAVGDVQVADAMMHSGPQNLHSDSAVVEITKHSTSHHETDGKCVCPCCLAPAVATLIDGVWPNVALRSELNAFPISNGKVPTGFALIPLTGPPKFST